MTSPVRPTRGASRRRSIHATSTSCPKAPRRSSWRCSRTRRPRHPLTTSSRKWSSGCRSRPASASVHSSREPTVVGGDIGFAMGDADDCLLVKRDAGGVQVLYVPRSCSSPASSAATRHGAVARGAVALSRTERREASAAMSDSARYAAALGRTTVEARREAGDNRERDAMAGRPSAVRVPSSRRSSMPHTHDRARPRRLRRRRKLGARHPRAPRSGQTVRVPPVLNRSLSGDAAYIRSFVETDRWPGGPRRPLLRRRGDHRRRRRRERGRSRLRVGVRARRGREPRAAAGRLPRLRPGPEPRVQAVPDRGRRHGTDVSVNIDAFPAVFAAGVTRGDARVLAVSQRPLAAFAFGEPATGAAWKTKPGWGIVVERRPHDQPRRGALRLRARRAALGGRDRRARTW